MQFYKLKYELIKEGLYDAGETYAGPGKAGDEVVPDFEFGEPSYMHDVGYSYIKRCREKGVVCLVTKDQVDLAFYHAMRQVKAKYPLKDVRAKLYYWAVKWFGGGSL